MRINKKSQIRFKKILICLVFLIGILSLYFVLAGDVTSSNSIPEKEYNPNKYQKIETDYVTFELPYYATHYWINDAPDRYEVIISNFSIKDNNDYILRATWYDDRYISESLQIHYEFKNGKLSKDDIKFYSLDKYDKSCMDEIPNDKSIKAKEQKYKDCEKAKDNSKLRFITPKIEIGHLIGYEYRLEQNFTCSREQDKLQENQDYEKCNINVSYPIYSWSPYSDISTIKISPDFIAIDDVSVSACGTLNTENQHYDLDTDIPNLEETCFTIENNNITLDFNGYSVSGIASINGYIGNYQGVYSNGYNGTTIKDGTVYDFEDDGIEFYKCYNITIQNMTSNLNYRGVNFS